MIELKNFYELTLDEKFMVLDWRNDLNTRRWMYSSDKIDKEHHLKYIESLKSSIGRKYFLVFKDNLPIGVIYFTDIDTNKKSCEFGLYRNPDLKGVGNILMDKIINYACEELKLNRIVAEVFHDNLKAIELYKKKGFSIYDQKLKENKTITYMEYKYEDR